MRVVDKKVMASVRGKSATISHQPGGGSAICSMQKNNPKPTRRCRKQSVGDVIKTYAQLLGNAVDETICTRRRRLSSMRGNDDGPTQRNRRSSVRGNDGPTQRSRRSSMRGNDGPTQRNRRTSMRGNGGPTQRNRRTSMRGNDDGPTQRTRRTSMRGNDGPTQRGSMSSMVIGQSHELNSLLRFVQHNDAERVNLLQIAMSAVEVCHHPHKALCVPCVLAVDVFCT